MKIVTTQRHQLEVGDGEVWAPATASIYTIARELAEHGRLVEALRMAIDARYANFPAAENIGIMYRIVTTTTTEIQDFGDPSAAYDDPPKS
jgi:hypothetical protein